MTKSFALLFAAACFSLSGCGEKKADSSGTNTVSSGNPLTAPADYVGALGKAQKSAQKTLGTAGMDQALKSFYADEGRYPTNLNELVSRGTIASIPNPPNGMKYDYDPKTAALKIIPQ